MTATVGNSVNGTETVAANTITSGSLSTTGGANTVIMVEVGWDSGVATPSGTISGVTDQAGNAYAVAPSPWPGVTRATTAQSLDVWMTTSATPTALSSQTVTVTFAASATEGAVIRVTEIKNTNSTAPIVAAKAAGAASSNTAVSVGTATPTVNDQLACGITTTESGSVRSFSSAPSFTQGAVSSGLPTTTTFDSSAIASTSHKSDLNTCFLTMNSTNAQTYSGTLNNAANWVAAIIIFADAPAAGSKTPQPLVAPSLAAQQGSRW